jgi:hypothetical protein
MMYVVCNENQSFIGSVPRFGTLCSCFPLHLMTIAPEQDAGQPELGAEAAAATLSPPR